MLKNKNSSINHWRKRTFCSGLVFLALIYTSISFAESATEPSRSLSNQSNSVLSFSNIVTAYSAGAQEAMVVGGGRWFTQRKLVHSAVLVRHPKGDFLWDSGIGSEVKAQMESFSMLERQLFKIEQINPAAKQLEETGYAVSDLLAIIPSHMHWDHVSGIEDFIGVPVWVKRIEHEGAKDGEPPAFVASQFDSQDLKWTYISLDQTPYRGFPASKDVFGDGSVVLVDLSGHTQGQLGMFLNTDKKSYFFIGDTTWAIEGIKHNIGRPRILNWAMGIDFDVEKNDQLINAINQLSQTDPDLVIVPAHDENVTATLPIYPEFL